MYKSSYIKKQKLSPLFYAFISKLPCVHIPRNVQDALGDLVCIVAIFEAMKACDKHETWDVVDLLEVRKLQDANGCLLPSTTRMGPKKCTRHNWQQKNPHRVMVQTTLRYLGMQLNSTQSSTSIECHKPRLATTTIRCHEYILEWRF